MDRYINGQIETSMDRQIYKCIVRYINMWLKNDRQIDGQTDSWIDRQMDRDR